MCYSGRCKYELFDGECGVAYPKPKDGHCRIYEDDQSTEDYDLDLEDYEEAYEN